MGVTRRIAPVFIALILCLTPLLHAAEPVEVIIEGIEGDLLVNVNEALVLPHRLLNDGKVDRLWLERFRLQAAGSVRAAMEPFGYYRAHVDATIEEGGSGSVRLRVRVAPGEPVRVTDVVLDLRGPGAGEGALMELAALFPLAKGDVLLQQKYERAKGALLARAQELGYLDADYSVHEIRIAKTADTARIRLEMETGRLYYFAEARIEGAPGYPDAFLRRYLAFKPGDIFTYARLGETQLNFTNSERFREVSLTPEKKEARESRIPVLVSLKPAPSRSLHQGIGYGTDTGGRFSVRYRDLNLLDRAHEFYSNLFISERLQGAVAGYILPDLTDIRGSTVLQFNLQQEDVSTYMSRLVSLELNRNRSFGKERQGTAYFRLQKEDYTVGNQESGARLLLPGLRFSGNHYDSPSRPSKGYRYAFELRGTHGLLGSDTGLLQFISEGSYLLPLPWRLSLLTRGKAGITLLSDPLSDLPPSLRFFAGGDRSVRGYAYQSLGPLDATGQVAGGKNLLVGGLELERALFEKWGVSLFYDAGNAFDSFAAVRLNQGAGIGLHYYTPVGGLNLFVARQVGVEDPRIRIHFTVGFEL